MKLYELSEGCSPTEWATEQTSPRLGPECIAGAVAQVLDGYGLAEAIFSEPTLLDEIDRIGQHQGSAASEPTFHSPHHNWGNA